MTGMRATHNRGLVSSLITQAKFYRAKIERLEAEREESARVLRALLQSSGPSVNFDAFLSATELLQKMEKKS